MPSTSCDVKSSKKKDDGRKRASGKNVIKKDEAKTLSSDDEMDVSPKSAKKPAKGEGNLKDTYYEGAIESFDAAKKKHMVITVFVIFLIVYGVNST
ncbi:hypothetical protein Tco_1350813 [Tanacetum coccineum]